MDMNSLRKYLNESLLDDEEDLVEITTVDDKAWLEENYDINGSYTLKNGVVDVTGNIKAKNLKLTRLTNGDFKFGKVSGDFSCWKCTELESLKDAPYEVGREFNCSVCEKLESLKGAPEKVGRSFECVNCKNLKSLEGAPQKVINFNCGYCGKLKNLKGGPQSCENLFQCYRCRSLTSLEGAPNSGYIMNFDCSYCGKLKNIDGLTGKISGLDLRGCKKLESLDALENIKVNTIFVQGCDNLDAKRWQNHRNLGIMRG